MKKFTLEVDETQIRVIRKALCHYYHNLYDDKAEGESLLKNKPYKSKSQWLQVVKEFAEENIDPVINQINKHIH